jgi:hypothetical protein
MKFKFHELTDDEFAELMRPARGQGGFQTFIRRLQGQVNPATHTARLTDNDVTDIQHYAFDFQEGGFQDRLRLIFARVLGPNVGRDHVADA